MKQVTFNTVKIGRQVFNDYECPKCFKILTLSKQMLRGYSSGICHDCDIYHHKGPYELLIRRYYGMIQRCYDSKCKEYGLYGGRGVIVCDEWRNNRNSFIDWAISNGYSKELSVDKDIKSRELGIEPPMYSPETCMFVTGTLNSGNTRKIIKTNTSGFRGVSQINLQNSNRIMYSAIFTHETTTNYVGEYFTKIEAAVAYDLEASKITTARTINNIEDTDIVLISNITNNRKKLSQDIKEVKSKVSVLQKTITKLQTQLEDESSKLEELQNSRDYANELLTITERKYLGDTSK